MERFYLSPLVVKEQVSGLRQKSWGVLRRNMSRQNICLKIPVNRLIFPELYVLDKFMTNLYVRVSYHEVCQVNCFVKIRLVSHPKFFFHECS